jgi:hypothetical protein
MQILQPVAVAEMVEMVVEVVQPAVEALVELA